MSMLSFRLYWDKFSFIVCLLLDLVTEFWRWGIQINFSYNFCLLLDLVTEFGWWVILYMIHPSLPPGKKSLGAGGGSKFYMQIKLISVYLICSMPPAPSCCVSSQLCYFYVLFMIDIFSRSTAVWLLSQCLLISYFLEEASDHLCISNFLK